jgi:hypothetical protein
MQVSFKLLTQELKPISGEDEGSPFHDIFLKTPCAKAGITIHFKQDDISVSSKLVLRGIHCVTAIHTDSVENYSEPLTGFVILEIDIQAALHQQ